MKSYHSTVGALVLSLAASGSAFALFVPGTANAGTCTIGFGSQTGLSILWNGVYPRAPVFAAQALGFMEPVCTRARCGPLGTCSTNSNLCAPAPGQSACGDPNWNCVQPNTNPEETQIWYFEQCTSNGDWFYFDENPSTNYGHLHISPDDPNVFDCFTNDSSGAYTWGKMNNGVCTAIDATLVSRNIEPHEPDEWMRIVDVSGSFFRPSQIEVLPGSALVKVAFVDSNNTWWQYNIPDTGSWTLNPTGTYGTIAYIGTNGNLNNHSNFNIDNLSLETQ